MPEGQNFPSVGRGCPSTSPVIILCLLRHILPLCIVFPSRRLASSPRAQSGPLPGLLTVSHSSDPGCLCWPCDRGLGSPPEAFLKLITWLSGSRPSFPHRLLATRPPKPVTAPRLSPVSNPVPEAEVSSSVQFKCILSSNTSNHGRGYSLSKETGMERGTSKSFVLYSHGLG